jgi:CelD/BcsL family acetyltransferase involved in cellulose biosynthesis
MPLIAHEAVARAPGLTGQAEGGPGSGDSVGLSELKPCADAPYSGIMPAGLMGNARLRSRMSDTMQSIEWIRDPTRVGALGDEWDQLAMRELSPFLTSRWLRAWWTAFADRRRPLVAALWRDGALAGGVPLIGGRWGWDSAANFHSPFFGLVAEDAEARQGLAEQVVARSGAWTLPRLISDEPSLGAVVAAARRQRRLVLVEPQETFFVADTVGTVDDYRARMSAKTRSELGRLRRKASREHTLELRPLARPTDLERQLARALKLEASGWKGRAGTAILCSPQDERFFHALAHEFDAIGAFRISELCLDGDLAAMALGIIHGGRVFTLKIAYDERHRRLGPGLLLLMAMIEQCFELGLQGYEFCGSAWGYEQRFANAERRLCRVRLYRRDPVNASRYVYRAHVRPQLRIARRRILSAIPNRG